MEIYIFCDMRDDRIENANESWVYILSKSFDEEYIVMESQVWEKNGNNLTKHTIVHLYDVL